MMQAKIRPGETHISLAGKNKPSRKEQGATGEEKDLLPELGLKRPTQQKSGQPKASPLDDDGIDLGED
jgi:hypothetical protein